MSMTTMLTRLRAALAMLAVLLIVTACSGSNHFDAPTGLSATLGTAAQAKPVVLKWSPAQGSFASNIYRGTVSGGVAAKTRIALNVASAQYIDTSAPANTTCYYQVTAVNSTGESGGSNEVSITSAPIVGGAIENKPLSLKNSVATVAGSTTAGTADGAGTAAAFSNPCSVTSDGVNLYIADTSNNSIRKMVISTGAVTTLAGSGTAGAVDGLGKAAAFNGPAGVTTDGANIFVADTKNNTVRRIVIASGAVTTLAGSGAAGSADGAGLGATFNHPSGITTDGISVYLADTGNNKIRKIEIATGAVTTLAGSDVSGNSDGAGAAALFNAPRGIVAVGSFLFVADTGNNMVRKIIATTGAVTTFAGSGASGSADAVATAATFNAPQGITTDGTVLYVADTGNNSIRIITAAETVTTLAGTLANGSGAATFSAPVGLTTDGKSLYIADSGNNSIRRVE